jgi:hypothetical protein
MVAVPVASWPHRVPLFGPPRTLPHGRRRVPPFGPPRSPPRGRHHVLLFGPPRTRCFLYPAANVGDELFQIHGYARQSGNSRFRRRSKSSRSTDRPRSTHNLRAKPPPQNLRFHERGEIGTAVIGRSRHIICESLAAFIERYRKDTVPPSRRTLGGRLKTDPSSQPENKNSPHQLKSEAGLSSGVPRRFRVDSRRGGPPSIGEPCWTTTMCCLHNCVTPSFASGTSVKST